MPKDEKPKRIRTRCQTCKGKGQVKKEVAAYNEKTKTMMTVVHWELCVQCIGTGFVWH